MEGHLPIPPKAGHTWAIDILGSIPKVGHFRKIFVAVCTLSRYTWAVPLCSGTAAEVIKQFDFHFRLLGYPQVVVNDNAGAFTGSEFKTYLQSHNIKNIQPLHTIHVLIP